MPEYARELLYTQLLDLCLEDRYAPLHPHYKLTNKKLKGITYLYAQFRDPKTGRQKQIYLGKETEALRQRLASLSSRDDDTLTARRELTRSLRSLGVARPTDAVAALMAHLASLGIFNAGGVLVGTHAFTTYLNVFRGPKLSMPTEDVDVAADRLAVASSAVEDLERALRQIDETFTGVPQLQRKFTHLSTSYKTRGRQLRLDILTPAPDWSAKPVRIDALGTHATAVPMLDFLIDDAIDAVIPFKEGILVRVPAPHRFALHKLLVASEPSRKKFAPKQQKDVAQAAWLLEALPAAGYLPDLKQAALELSQQHEAAWNRATALGSSLPGKAGDIVKAL